MMILFTNSKELSESLILVINSKIYPNVKKVISAAADPPYCDTYRSPQGNKQQHTSN